MDIKKNVEVIIDGIFDCLEECMDSLTLATGHRILKVFFVCLVFQAYTIIALILEKPVIITWQEVLPACIFTGVLSFIEFMNETQIEQVRARLREIKKKGRVKDGSD